MESLRSWVGILNITKITVFSNFPHLKRPWCWEGLTEDEMAGWHHRLNEHGFGWTLGGGDGQGGLACCSSCGRKESDMTERLNWTKNNSRIWFRTLSIALKEELKVLDLVFWLNYYSFVSLDCFLVFLHFLSSLIKFSLWNLEGLGGSSLSINKRQGDTRVVTVPGKAIQYPTSFQ